MDRIYTINSDAGLPPPMLPDEDAGYLEDGVVQVDAVPAEGIRVVIPSYVGMKPGDVFRVCTQPADSVSCPIYGPWERNSGAQRGATLRRITLKGMSLLTDQIAIHYQVLGEDGGYRTSQPLSLRLTYKHEADRMPAPVLAGGLDDDGLLPPDATSIKATVALTTDSTTLDIFVLGTDLTIETFALSVYGADERNVVIDASEHFRAESNSGGVIRMWYEVNRHSSWLGGDITHYVSDVLEIPVGGEAPSQPKAPLIVGGARIVEAEPYFVAIGVPPANPPAHVVRTVGASGGVGPYLYSSSNPCVAVVDANGTVAAVGNGVSQILVTDADGDTASFDFIVTGATVLMPVLTQPHVDADGKETRAAAGERLQTIWYQPGVLAGLAALRGLWKQYTDGEQGVADMLGWKATDAQNAEYWVNDSYDSALYAVNLNAIRADDLVRRKEEAKANEKHFIAIVETNMWCGFEENWYRSGRWAKAANQPYYDAAYNALPEWEP